MRDSACVAIMILWASVGQENVMAGPPFFFSLSQRAAIVTIRLGNVHCRSCVVPRWGGLSQGVSARTWSPGRSTPSRGIEV